MALASPKPHHNHRHNHNHHKHRLFREYIGADFKGVTFSDIPINPNVEEVHFILSFAIDYTTSDSNSSPQPTNGDFKAYWDTQNLSPSHVSSIKSSHPRVKVALSLGGDSIGEANQDVYFQPTSVKSWLRNAIYSVTQLVKTYHLDGIDIDYEHFNADPETFAECIGKLIFYLKQNKIISFASIAPYDDSVVQAHYLALWKKYGHLIDYVNFQFYAYQKGTTKTEFIAHYENQMSNYEGGKVLVSFSTDGSGDIPINPNVEEVHFILSFAIDYTTSDSNSSPQPTNGDFKAYWDTQNLSPSHVSSIKSSHPRVKVALSLGGDSIGEANQDVYFQPTSVKSWLRNAIYSITQLVKTYHLDGIDIDYEHFNADPETFAECIGKLIFYLKQNKIISFASIAPYDDSVVQAHYLALWKKYGHLIDYVNFQFYAYQKGTTKSEFIAHYENQMSNYEGGKVLVSFSTDGSGGLSPKHGFFEACKTLSHKGNLHGIFIWSADDSKQFNFRYEVQTQKFLAST
ncbi:chitinase 2-like [Senna tora]|uniref:Chitinase 2-like n=1 Tax=Senna tora TaxID=362788 RepID=A0A834W476_9FABA|nr:chitinase 2-like [Senna tora]